MSVRLRPRNAWEALDLGLELVHAHWRAIYAAWFATYLPVAILAFAWFWDRPFWAWLTLWWLKPAFDRLALAVISRRLFDEPGTTREIVRATPGILWRSGIVAALTWRRFDFARSLHIPVYQLERLSGSAARSRIRVLDREARGPAVWLTFLLANVEFLFGLAISLMVALLVPAQAPIETLLEGWYRHQFEGGHTGALLGAFAACLIEPFYVASGFTLYLQRRTMLEGWDIELRFRQMSERIDKARRAAAAGATMASVLLAALLFLAWPRPSIAAGEGAASPDPATQIKAVLADKEFGHKETVTRLKWVGPTAKPSSASKPIDWSWLEAFSRFSAEVTRVVLWIAGGGLLLFGLYYLARYLRLHGFGRARTQRPDFLFGLDVRPSSLPADVAGTAENLARAGRVREALSLLYRGSLVRFMDSGIEFQQGDTEGDCTRRVEAAETPRRKAYFSRLVLHWQVLAYGHHSVTPDAAIALARAWRGEFPSEPHEDDVPAAQST
jgi:hypothetical protein